MMTFCCFPYERGHCMRNTHTVCVTVGDDANCSRRTKICDVCTARAQSCVINRVLFTCVLQNLLRGPPLCDDTELCFIALVHKCFVMMRYSFARTAVVEPVTIVCMMKLVRQDHCFRGPDLLSRNSGIPCSNFVLTCLLDLGCTSL